VVKKKNDEIKLNYYFWCQKLSFGIVKKLFKNFGYYFIHFRYFLMNFDIKIEKSSYGPILL
jgi:hypothetical protein